MRSALPLLRHRWWALLGVVALRLVAPLGATTVVPPDFATLVNDSDAIVRAVTKSVTAEKRASTRGVKIVTRVEFEVREVIAGRAPATMTLEFLGGRVGKEAMRVDGMPQFKVGDEDVLFVSGAGASICPLYAMMHGRYAVRTEAATGRQYLERADGAPLQSTAAISWPLLPANVAAAVPRSTGLAPATFTQLIQASVRPDARLHRVQE